MNWISVEDRLPKEGDYLVSNGTNVTCAYLDAYGDWGASSFVSPTYEMSRIFLHFIVKYWSDLPNPPEL